MKTILAVIALALLSACATTPEPVVRSATTMNSGIPLSDGLKAYELGHYVLRLEIIPDDKAIAGSADVAFTANTDMDVLELDFDGLLAIDSITDSTGPLEYTRSDAKLFVNLRDTLAAGASSTVTVAYHGKPVEAARPPWDGGFQWATTPSGKPWVATAVQGEGCDIWWPCKDHPQGEPPGMDLHFTVPEGLTATSNGVLRNVETLDDGRRTFHWRTEVPTNTYGIAVNVAPYVLIEDTYTSVNGTEIPVMFWAIEDHEEPARELFEKEFFDVIEFFERKVGPYPWGQEKLGVTETSHLGMEHQTINAYGNEFRRGDFGFDWLFHHELAHEWFGNVMTHVTVSDMWLHEGFGAFMQPQYTLETMGEAAFHAAMLRTYRGISSCNAIAPKTEFSEDELYFDDVEGKGPAGDIYSKGTWLLHSLQNMIGDEVFWRSVKILVYDTANPELLQPPIEARLRSTDDFMNIVNKESGRDLGWFFEVYARRGPLPELSATDSDDGVVLEWHAPDDLDFPMPTPVRVNGEMQLVEFENNRALLQGVSTDDILIDPYMQVLRKLPIVPTCEERRAEATANPHG
ncbi:MAG: M1 family metallopeptidase [Woeseiaceae bacterium]